MVSASASVITSPQAFDPLVAASGAVLNLVACCSVGVTASKARVLDQQAISALSRLVYNVFQPSLLFTNVLQTLATPNQSRGTLLLLPLAAALQILAAGALSGVLLRLVGLDPRSETGREARICSTFANAGPLPLLFVDALFKNHPDPTLRPRAVAFISFYLLAWSPLFWNYGYGILTGREGGGRELGDVLDTHVTLHKKDLGGPVVSGVGGVTGSGNGAGSMVEEGSGSGKESSTATLAYPQLQIQEECARDPAMFVLARMRRFLGSRAVKKLLNPPTLGCTMGALVGVIPPLRG
jgi:predicted permease|eukprot:evm.model.NODE_523_length_9815_cov_28.945593.3